MRAYVSLWSADLLAVGAAVDELHDVVDGFHIDVFDGHNVRELLFGPDFVAALRRRTDALLDVHLNVEDPQYWTARFADAGADMVTVQPRACQDPLGLVRGLRRQGRLAGIGLEVEQAVDELEPLVGECDRVLVMGTSLGIKGVDLDPSTTARVQAVRRLLRRTGSDAEVVVDGGIRRGTVGLLAEAGADGVVPGSLVMSEHDPVAAVARLHALPSHAPSGAPGT